MIFTSICISLAWVAKGEHFLTTNAFKVYGQSPLKLISTHSQNLFAFLEVNIRVMVLVEY